MKVVSKDLNGDNYVNMADVSLLLKIINGMDTADVEVDLNGDGYVNMIDVSLLLKTINVGKETE